MAQGPQVPWTSGTISRYTAVPTLTELGLVVHESTADQTGSSVPRRRECGDPAIDGCVELPSLSLGAHVEHCQAYCSKLSAQLTQVEWTWVISASLTAVRPTC
jgi:hypothetical protein